MLELAGNAARDNKKKLITPRHILLAVANDDELHRVGCCVRGSHPLTLPFSPQLLKGVTISQGGVLPHIPEVLLFRKSQLSKAGKGKVPPPPSSTTKTASSAPTKAVKPPPKTAAKVCRCHCTHVN